MVIYFTAAMQIPVWNQVPDCKLTTAPGPAESKGHSIYLLLFQDHFPMNLMDSQMPSIAQKTVINLSLGSVWDQQCFRQKTLMLRFTPQIFSNFKSEQLVLNENTPRFFPF